MALIRKKEKREMPALSTSSLPDIIFMLLFFFMAVTNLKKQLQGKNYTATSSRSSKT
jgi:biopolymer transport protein ExbD